MITSLGEMLASKNKNKAAERARTLNKLLCLIEAKTAWTLIYNNADKAIIAGL